MPTVDYIPAILNRHPYTGMPLWTYFDCIAAPITPEVFFRACRKGPSGSRLSSPGPSAQCIQGQWLSSKLNNAEMMECTICLEVNNKQQTGESNQEENGKVREHQTDTNYIQRVRKISSDKLSQKRTNLYPEATKFKPQNITLPPLLERYTATTKHFNDENIVERKWNRPREFSKSCTDLCQKSDANQPKKSKEFKSYSDIWKSVTTDSNQSTKFRKCPKCNCQFGFKLDYSLPHYFVTERDGNLKHVDRSTGTTNEEGVISNQSKDEKVISQTRQRLTYILSPGSNRFGLLQDHGDRLVDYEEVDENVSQYFSCGESPNKSLTTENGQSETSDKTKNIDKCCSEQSTEKHTRNKDVPSNDVSDKIIDTCRQQLMCIPWDSLALQENQIKCVIDKQICNSKTNDESPKCLNCDNFKICKVLLQLILACSVMADKSFKITEVLLKTAHRSQLSSLRTLQHMINILFQQANVASIISHGITENRQKLTCSGEEQFHPKNLTEINSQILPTLMKNALAVINYTKDGKNSTVTLSKETNTPQKEKIVSNTSEKHMKTKPRYSRNVCSTTGNFKPFENPTKETNNRSDDNIENAESDFALETSRDNALEIDIQKHTESVSTIEPNNVLEPESSLDLGSIEEKPQGDNQIRKHTTVDVCDESCSVRRKQITENHETDKNVEDNSSKHVDKTGNENMPKKEDGMVSKCLNRPVTCSGNKKGCTASPLKDKLHNIFEIVFEQQESSYFNEKTSQTVSRIRKDKHAITAPGTRDKSSLYTHDYEDYATSSLSEITNITSDKFHNQNKQYNISDIATNPTLMKKFYEKFWLKQKRRQNNVKHAGTQVNAVDLTYSNDLVSRMSDTPSSRKTKSVVVKRKLATSSNSKNDAIPQSPAKYIRLLDETRSECKNELKANESTKNPRRNSPQSCKRSTPKCIPRISSSEKKQGSRCKYKQNDSLLKCQQNTKTKNIKKNLFRTKDISSKREVRCSSSWDVKWNGRFRNVCIQIDLPEIKKIHPASKSTLVYHTENTMTKPPIKRNEPEEKLTKSKHTYEDSKLNEPGLISRQQVTSDKILHDGRELEVKKISRLEFTPKAKKITDVAGEEFQNIKKEMFSRSQEIEDKKFTGFQSDSSSSEDDSLSCIRFPGPKQKPLNDYSITDDDLPHLVYPRRYRKIKRCQRLDFKEFLNSTRKDLKTNLSVKKKEQHIIQNTNPENQDKTGVQSSDNDSDSRHDDTAKTGYNKKTPRRHRRRFFYSSSEEHIPPARKRGFQYTKECMRILEKVYNLEISDPFRHEVQSKDIPTYYVTVKRGMSFDLIAYKLRNNIYEDRADFVSDMRLVFDNCRLYYKDKLQFCKAADIVEGYFEKLYRESWSEDKDF